MACLEAAPGLLQRDDKNHTCPCHIREHGRTCRYPNHRARDPLRTAYAVAEPNRHRAVALFKLRPDHTADEQVEAVVELTQSALDLLEPGMIKPL